MQTPTALLVSYLEANFVASTGSKYAHWIGLYLSFHLSWVLGPFVHGRLLKTSKDTFGHDITPLK